MVVKLTIRLPRAVSEIGLCDLSYSWHWYESEYEFPSTGTPGRMGRHSRQSPPAGVSPLGHTTQCRTLPTSNPSHFLLGALTFHSHPFPFPSPPIPSLLLSLPFSPPLLPNPAIGLGSAVSLPTGSGRSSGCKTHYDAFMAVKTHLVAKNPTFRGLIPLTPLSKAMTLTMHVKLC